MKKRSFIYFTFLATVFLLTFSASAAASGGSDEAFYEQLADLLSQDEQYDYFDKMELTIGSKILRLDGEEQWLDVAPEISKDRTMLPVRAVAEAAGAEVGWEPSTRTVTVTSAYGDEISLQIGVNQITVNSETTQIDVEPYIKGDRTYLPVRAVSEALDLDVGWDGSTSTVSLTAPYQTARLVVLAKNVDTTGLDAAAVLNDGSGMWVLQFDSPTRAKTAEALLKADGYTVEPDYYLPPGEEEVSNIDSFSSAHNSWGAEDCGFDEFISRNRDRFSGAEVVAVVDTGVDASHPYLQGRITDGYDFVDTDHDPNDQNDHGTHLAGTIIDCVGNAPVQIMPVRVLNENGRGVSCAVAAGIKYAALHGADIINLSLGGKRNTVIDEAVDAAIMQGSLVVAAAGNEYGQTSDYSPAHITTAGMIVVSAGDTNHNKAAFSNIGNSVDLMAPGVRIKASVRNGYYGYMSGTSMAAPHASAAAALLDLASKQTLSPEELEKQLHTATSNGVWTNETIGFGFLDLRKTETPVTPSITLSPSTASISVGQTQELSAITVPANQNITWSSSDPGVAAVDHGAVTAMGAGTAAITAAMLYEGRTYSATCEITVNENASIVIEPSGASLATGETVSLSVVTRPEGQTVSWGSSNPEVASVNQGTVTGISPGSAVITANMTLNGREYSASSDIIVTQQASLTLNQSSASLAVGSSLTLTANTTPENMEVTWQSDQPNIAQVSAGNVTARGEGSATITAQMTYAGQQYSASCTITVISNEWTTEKLPDKDGFTVESKAQYRFRHQETITSTETALPGWTLYDQAETYGPWGDWSEWKNGTRENGGTTYYNLYYYKYWNTSQNAWYYTYSSSMGGTKYTITAKASDCKPYRIYDNHQAYTFNGHNLWWIEGTYQTDAQNKDDTVDVETRKASGEEYYHLYYYKYWNASQNGWYYTWSSAMGGTKYTATAKASDCKPYNVYNDRQAYTYNGHNLWWVESTSKENVDQYRTRTRGKYTTYYFYRWSDWSNWEDGKTEAAEDVQVETRTLYRYIPA